MLTNKFWRYALTALAGILLLPPLAVAEKQVPPGGEAVPAETLSEGEAQGDELEKRHMEWSRKIISTASYMDSFFDDSRYATTSNKTYLRLRLSPILDKNGLSFNSYVDLRLLLPNTERWLLTVGGDPDKEDRYGSSPLQGVESENSSTDERNAYVGLNTFFKQTRTRNIGMGGGIRFRNRGLIPYASFKWAELWEFSEWDMRATQRVRYYTDTGPEFKSMLDAEWPIAHKFFARGSGSVLLKYDDPSVYYDLDYSLYQYLTTRRALQYQIRTGYASKPGRPTYLSTVNYEVSYRQQWRNWFYTTLTPQISQTDDNDWVLEPGIRFDFNIIIGHTDKHQFQSAYQKKQETLEQKAREERDEALRAGHERFMKWKQEQEKKSESQ